MNKPSMRLRRQELNVFRMRLLGTQVHAVEGGSRTLKDAINEAMRDWVTNVRTTYYLLGSVVGPHPYPVMVRDFQSVIGREVRAEFRRMGRLPDALVACVGGGSNSIGSFHAFVRDKQVNPSHPSLTPAMKAMAADIRALVEHLVEAFDQIGRQKIVAAITDHDWYSSRCQISTQAQPRVAHP